MSKLLRGARRDSWDLGTTNAVRPDDPTSARDFQPYHEASVWVIEEHGSNLHRIIAALASKRTWPSNLDYVLFDEALVRKLGITMRQTTGTTLDEEANKRWHRDLNMSEAQALELVREIKKPRGSSATERVREKDVLKCLARAVEEGRIDLAQLEPKVRDRVQTELSKRASGN